MRRWALPCSKRNVLSSLPLPVYTRIQTALIQLETTHGVRILYVCEAGSRAWGFPSPGSDYDVRFVYVHPPEWYLTLDEGPDTLSFPIDEKLDLAGWELRKALKLLRGSNAALYEWLQSPVVYQEVPGFRAAVAPLLESCWNPRAGLHHYLGLVRRGVEEDLVGVDGRLKRLFYTLRSTLAARWIQQQPGVAPPMAFQQLREVLPAAFNEVVDELLAVKATADEKMTVPLPAVLVAFLQEEYATAVLTRSTLPMQRLPDPTPVLNKLFQAWLWPQVVL